MSRKNTSGATRNKTVPDKNTLTGIFKRKYSGAGSVTANTETILISQREGYHLVDGDEIHIVTAINRKGIRTGKVIGLHKRRTAPIIGYFRSDSLGKRFYPLESRVSSPVHIKGNPPKSLGGKVVSVILEPDTNGKSPPRGRIGRVLGKRDDYGVQTEIFAAKFQLRDTMPDAVVNESETLIRNALNRDNPTRKNLTDVVTVTVDPENARDFDDALSLNKTPDGCILGVHIADVSHYIPLHSLVDHEAFQRGTSVYLPERAIHMLPEKLATDVCSLKPDENRLALSVMIEFDLQGRILGGEIFESVIRSDARLTYRDFLNASNPDNSGSSGVPETIRVLCTQLRELCEVLLQRRVERGVLDLDMPETEFSLDEHGKVTGIHKKARSVAEQTIEEFMIAANMVVAGFLDNSNTPWLRRVHDAPDSSEIFELKQALLQLGLKPPDNPLDPDDVRLFLNSIDNPAIRSVASHRILRSMKRAVYSAKKSGHFGLALDLYTQFTSPIRRYPDLLIHRSVKTALSIPGYSIDSVDVLEHKARQLSDSERRAQEAEWDAVKIEKVRFMQSRIGNTYQGTITHVMEFGAFVELDEPFVEGFIPVSKMDSFFRYNPVTNRLSNDDKTIILQPGQTVTVLVQNADTDRGSLDFTVVHGL